MNIELGSSFRKAILIKNVYGVVYNNLIIPNFFGNKIIIVAIMPPALKLQTGLPGRQTYRSLCKVPVKIYLRHSKYILNVLDI